MQEKEVRKWKEELLEQRRRMMEERLLHAEFKRELQLQAIVKKAQEEEAKVEQALPSKCLMWSLPLLFVSRCAQCLYPHS